MGKKYFDTKAETLESSILGVWAEAAKKQEGLNAVNPKALKKKFDDRKDKDIDNDGDVDDSDEYLHNRRQTVSKAVKNKVKDEGNAFGMALKAAKDKGEKTFVVSGKTYPVKEGLDEGKLGDQWQKGAKSVKSGSFELIRGKSGVHDIMKSGKKIGTFSYDDEGDNFVANMKGERGQLVGNDIDTLISNFKEEVDLEEGKMSQLHQYIKDKKSAEEIAKLMKVDVKTIKTLMSSNNPEDVEESAASDARRAMAKDKDFSRKDSADDDDDATDDDVKGASKNIIMQMRKAQSLNGRFPVEFADKKKVKIPAKMAIAVQQKYNAMKKPADKEKFQTRIGKSYKDMLSALKEELQPKKESILERMNRKIKENKDG